MRAIKNPARSRPLSANVKRLMKMARESPQNPDVEKIEREFTARDLAYCDMQGNIFMAAVDQDIPMDDFAPIFMNSQLAGVIDYSFSRAGNMEEDDIYDVLMSVQPGSIVRMHDGGGDQSTTVAALKRALPKLAKEGYSFVTIDEIMKYT